MIALGRPVAAAVAYVFAGGRGTEAIAGQLTGFSGILAGDGYAAYKALARDHGARFGWLFVWRMRDAIRRGV